MRVVWGVHVSRSVASSHRETRLRRACIDEAG